MSKIVHHIMSLLTVEDQFAGVSEGIGDLHEEGASLSGESLSGRPAGTREKQEVRGSCSADSIDDLLDAINPSRNARDVMGLVHDTTAVQDENEVNEEKGCRLIQDDALVAAILLGQLSPDGRKLVVRRTALSNDLAVPASVVVLWLRYETTCRFVGSV